MVDTGMVFAIILTVIVIGAVLAVGMNQIEDFFCVGNNAQAVKAVKDVESLVSEIFLLASGSSKTYTLSMPNDVRICFINNDDPGPQPYTNPEKTWDPGSLVIKDILQNPQSDQYGSNMWVYYCGKKLGEGYFMKHLSTPKSFCTVRGHEVYLENKGKFVDISILE